MYEACALRWVVLLRLAVPWNGALRSSPTVALLVGGLGGLGLVVAAVAVVVTLVRGPTPDAAAVFMSLGFLGFLSVVMTVAGLRATRANTTVVWREGDGIGWRSGSEHGRLPSERARLTLQRRGAGHYRSTAVMLVDAQCGPLAEVSASAFESVAQGQRRRIARFLGLPA